MIRLTYYAQVAIPVIAILVIIQSNLNARADSVAVATIHPSVIPLKVGFHQTVDMSIVIENVQDLYGAALNAHFDPAIVQVIDADLVASGVQLIPGSIPVPDSIVRNSADNSLGTLEYVVTQLNPTLPSNGSGIFVKIKFRGILQGGSSAFVIDYVKFSDRDGVPIPVTPQNGQIDVDNFVYYFPWVMKNGSFH